MKLSLLPAVFLRRYKRFLADVQLPDGSEITVHCPNSGSMRTLQTPGVPCWISDSNNPKRKLRYTLIYLSLPKGGKALVDTMLPNRIVADAITKGAIPELVGYTSLRREVSYGREKSRIDILLEHPDRPPCYVEVKNVTMLSEKSPFQADFPDSVSARGSKHLKELTYLSQKGIRAVQFFLVSRTDCKSSGIAKEIDSQYAKNISIAQENGVEILSYRARLSVSSATAGKRIPFVLPE